MARKRRYLVLSGLADAGFEEFAEQQRQALAACPEAAAISDDEAEAFLLAAAGFDWLEVSDLGAYIRRLGLSHPPELLYDPYRLSRYFFRHWGDPAVREKIKTPKIGLHPDWVARVRQRGNIAELHRAVINMAVGPGIAAMRLSGLEDFIPKVIEALEPFEKAKLAAGARLRRTGAKAAGAAAGSCEAGLLGATALDPAGLCGRRGPLVRPGLPRGQVVSSAAENGAARSAHRLP